MRGTELMELIAMIATFIPLFGFGIILLIVGFNGKKNDGKPKVFRNPNIRKAKVVDLQVKETRDEEGYLRNRQFFTTIEYEKDGMMKVNSFYHPYEYKTGSIIDVMVNNEGKVNILTPIPQGIFSLNEKMTTVKGYKVALIAGTVLTILGLLMLCSMLNILMGLAGVVLLLLFFSPMIFVAIKTYKNANRKLHGMENGYYETYDATIIDVRKHVSSGNNGTKTTYYSIVEYVNNNEVKIVEFADVVNIHAIGNTRRIYVNEKENDIQTDLTLKYIMWPTYLAIGAIAIFMAVLTIGFI